MIYQKRSQFFGFVKTRNANKYPFLNPTIKIPNQTSSTTQIYRSRKQRLLQNSLKLAYYGFTMKNLYNYAIKISKL